MSKQPTRHRTGDRAAKRRGDAKVVIRSTGNKVVKRPADIKGVKIAGRFTVAPMLAGAGAAVPATLAALAAKVRKLEERIEDLEDLAALNEAIARSNGKVVPWSEVADEILAKD